MVRPVPASIALAAVLFAGAAANGQLTPYNPYADSQEAPAPLAPDGTIQWGVFYKSAAMQKAYQRLWNLGACRGTNRAITEPVNRNKVIIDRLPEADYEGTVVAATGTLAGGMIVFSEPAAGGTAEPFVTQLHPAGVTRLRVTGRAPAAMLRPGHVIRVVTAVDAEGEGTEPLARFDLVTPPADYVPPEVKPGVRGEIVGTVKRLHKDVLTLHVPVGRLRRLTFTLPADAVATLDAARLDLVAPGDTIQLTGRLWSGEGALAGGTIFASDVAISKPPLPGEVAAPAAAAVAGQP
jgi:hypothetical protein